MRKVLRTVSDIHVDSATAGISNDLGCLGNMSLF